MIVTLILKRGILCKIAKSKKSYLQFKVKGKVGWRIINLEWSFKGRIKKYKILNLTLHEIRYNLLFLGISIFFILYDWPIILTQIIQSLSGQPVTNGGLGHLGRGRWHGLYGHVISRTLGFRHFSNVVFLLGTGTLWFMVRK